MPQLPSQEQASPAADDADLLAALLSSEVPSRGSQPRPARVRSATQQQQIALRGFLLRNWIDRVLQLAERGLVLAALLAFGYWMFDGPVRDWLHARRDAQVVWADAARPTPTPALTLPSVANSPVADGAPSLPFTRPEDAAPPAMGGVSRDEFLVPQAVPAAPVADDPRPMRLAFPSLAQTMDVREIYVVGGEWEVAEYAAGYHFGTALPGNIGNSVFSGHAGLRGAVFKDLGRLNPGDEVVIETARWQYTYRVRGSQNVWPTQVEVMDPTPTPTLTLITCTNWDTQRLVVVADLVGARPLS
jgi:sortase A